MHRLVGGLLQLLIIESTRHLQKGKNRIAGPLAGRRGRDAVFDVVGVLNGAAPLRFRDRLGHRIGEVVGVEQGLAIDVAGRPADGLDQGALRPQEALLIGVEDRHQRHLRQIQSFPQQVHAHQHVVFAIAEVLDDLDPLDRVDFGVEIAHLHAIFGQVIGEVLGHALGQCGDQHPFFFVGPLPDFAKQVIDLALGGTHLHDRIKHAGGADHLLDNLALALGHFPIARGGADKDRLLGLFPELIALERPVVGGRGQAEAVLNEHLLARLVAVVHGLQLGAGDVAFIDHQQPVLGEVINQAFGRRAGRPASQVAGVVFNAIAIAHLLEHLQVVGGALF